MSDGIEIHYDDKSGYLHLACEPNAFAPYREVARTQMSDFPEIDVDKVMELSITDTARMVARRDAPRRRLLEVIVGVVVVGILSLAVFGAVALVRLIA